MKKYWWAIFLVIFSTLLNTVAEVSFKIASKTFGFTFSGIALNLPLWFGALMYIISAVILIFAFSGGELSVLNPLQSFSFIWTTLGAWLILSEIISLGNIIGITIIVAGVVLISIEHPGGKK